MVIISGVPIFRILRYLMLRLAQVFMRLYRKNVNFICFKVGAVQFLNVLILTLLSVQHRYSFLPISEQDIRQRLLSSIRMNLAAFLKYGIINKLFMHKTLKSFLP